jgi:hypothetical protein
MYRDGRRRWQDLLWRPRPGGGGHLVGEVGSGDEVDGQHGRGRRLRAGGGQTTRRWRRLQPRPVVAVGKCAGDEANDGGRQWGSGPAP